MKISFSELLARGDAFDMVVHSLEQALYQVTVVIEGDELLLTENNGKTFRRHSLAAVLEALQPLPLSRLTLRQQSAYDEMIGQPPREGDNRLEIPLPSELYPPITKH